jgi:hypothetical protein
MPNNPADRRAGAPAPVPEANRIVRRIDLGVGFSAPASSSPATAPQPTPPATQLRETGGPTTLTMGAVADGKGLARSGTDIVGVTLVTGAPQGAATTTLSGTSYLRLTLQDGSTVDVGIVTHT